MPPPIAKAIHFGPFLVTSQVFHTTPFSFALVNLKPLLPGHVLICPHRSTPRLSQLTAAEIADLFHTVQLVSRTLTRVYGASALNISVQDGADAGQSVAHVHAHIIPRRAGDEGGGDRVYDMMEGEQGDVGRAQRELEEYRARARPRFPKLDEGSRRARSESEMRKEAEWLKGEMEKDARERRGGNV
ncbi:hypothetical protein B0A49_00324 [Cryomyces minteri]|uniref:Bis(5'-adenosyl)-triphosphatase n=1 Tax=Cryomyces minteri TaxID=331657 RepID=A0A4U0XS43_9PEZI|nr:hypothetical protein B0A49_00324 [Cryomyces minteri]